MLKRHRLNLKRDCKITYNPIHVSPHNISILFVVQLHVFTYMASNDFSVQLH